MSDKNYLARTLAALILCASSFSMQAATLCNTQALIPGARLENCGGLKVLRLQGNPIERAQAAGKMHQLGLLSRDVINHYSTMVEDGATSFSWLKPFFRLYYNFWIRQRSKGFDSPLFHELEVFADAAGFDRKAFMKALFLPDIGIYQEGKAAPTTMGCTTAARRFKDQFILGRNLDYAGVGIWDRHPMIVVHEPKAPGELRHLGVSAEGMPFASVTGVNEAGIYFGVHQNYTDAGKLSGGLPLFLVGEGMLRTVHNLEEAQSYLKQHRPMGVWTFVVADLKTGEAASIEVSQKFFGVVPMKDALHTQSNHLRALDPKIQRIFYGTYRNSVYRVEKAKELLKALDAKKALIPQMASILAYQESSAGDMSAEKDILKSLTLQSVVVESEPKKNLSSLSVGVDSAPTSSGSYVTLSLNQLFESRDENQALNFSKTAPIHSAAVRKKQTDYVQAEKLFEEENYSAAIHLLKNQNGQSARMTRAMAQLESKQPALALQDIRQALAQPASAIPNYLRDSYRWLEILALHRMGKKDNQIEAVTLAMSLLAAKPENPEHVLRLQAYLKQMKPIAEDDGNFRFPYVSLSLPYYDSFDGDIVGP